MILEKFEIGFWMAKSNFFIEKCQIHNQHENLHLAVYSDLPNSKNSIGEVYKSISCKLDGILNSDIKVL
jgi:hypothetical protein